MDKQIFIRDYSDKQIPVVIENIEDIVKIQIEILTGDEVMTVIYKDGTSQEFDSSGNRILSFYDGKYTITVEQLDEFSEFEGSSCDNMERFEEI